MTLPELITQTGQVIAWSWDALSINIPILNVSVKSVVIAILIIQLSTFFLKKFILKDNEDD